MVGDFPTIVDRPQQRPTLACLFALTRKGQPQEGFAKSRSEKKTFTVQHITDQYSLLWGWHRAKSLTANRRTKSLARVQPIATPLRLPLELAQATKVLGTAADIYIRFINYALVFIFQKTEVQLLILYLCEYFTVCPTIV